MWIVISPFVLAFFGAVIGGLITHAFSKRRAVDAERREIIIKNLVEAYDAFDASTLTDAKDEMRAIERVVARVQLFGDEKLISRVKDFCDDVTHNGNSNIDPLMREIRAQIRRELNLPAIDADFAVLRFLENEKAK